MSWLWSNPPPEDETGSSSATDPYVPPNLETSFDTTLSSATNDVNDDFGTAFSDDIDLTPPQNEPNTTRLENYMDSGSSPPSDFSFSNPAVLSSDNDNSVPTIDFSSINRINPSVLSARPSLQYSPSVDYVFADDYNDMRKKPPAEQLTFLAGSAYLLGGTTGAAIGLASAIPASAGKPARLRINAALNAVAKRGTSLGNTFGVLALTFSLSESLLYNCTNDETLANYAGAGAMAGALFRSTHGIRPAATWGVGGACLALATVYASRQGYYGRGLQGVL